MKRSWLCVCVILISGLIPLGAATDTSQYLQQPDRDKKLAEIQGQIKDIDIGMRQLTLQDHAGQTVTLRVASEARVLDTENHQVEWTSLHVGDNVLAYYNTQTLMTLQIDLHPSVSDVLLGEPKHN